MLSSSKPVVLLPTYNERENLAKIVHEILKLTPCDVWILDDNSPDGTGKIADELVITCAPRVRVTHRPAKRGLGAAYIAGFKLALAAGYSHILEMDADFSHPLAKINELLAAAEEYDLVLGSRWVEGGGTRNWPLQRQLISRFGSLYARWILGLDVLDLTGGFKCFRREVLEALDLEQIKANGYAFQIETTYLALRKGFKVKEIPIIFVERENGQSKMNKKIIYEAIWRVLALRFQS